ncbi:BMP family ABC transporter substrate-binding protein (plasmid) [Halococcus dombrowskii]|uniref:BMP family ABC transporter substrate-binding protein n=2 Tax=Halococcus dombrowskii TaxID=179637 RepID=A0AAX3AT52_HALDO|nr:BMP family ABC transporter substrate-binding protein [Halococcus dombrowskii]UOO97266.1 BMP family ABC transporter substrate-binding protein [Halococcus dombrowskii]
MNRDIKIPCVIILISEIMDRRRYLKGVVLGAGTAGLSGCLGGNDSTSNSSGGNGSGSGGSGGNGSSGGSGGGATQIAIISSPAGFGDNAFNDNALMGLKDASDNYNIKVNQVEETDPSNYESVQANLAQEGSYGVIVLVASEHLNALEQNASDYPDQNWMLINDYVDQPNVSGWIAANNQMSFLAGVLAGTMTTEQLDHKGGSTTPNTAQVGFVGGQDTNFINTYERSYAEGAQWVNENVKVNAGYAGSFSDASAAANIANSQYDNGADIIYHAASAAGTGVFSAAQNKGRFAVGVDVDQSQTQPDYKDVIIGSGVKHLNESTQTVAEAAAQGKFKSVTGQNRLTIDNKGVDVVIGKAFKNNLPDVISKKIDQAKKGLSNGDIELSCGPTGC